MTQTREVICPNTHTLEVTKFNLKFMLFQLHTFVGDGG